MKVKPDTKPKVLVLMGVSGCGKTTVATILASRLGWPFQEGDALHPEANIEKMASGNPLTDADRWPWLTKVADWIDQRIDNGESGLITCSALKRSYRDFINRRHSGLIFVYLAGSKETIVERLAERRGHFMRPRLLDSQFVDLEEPAADEPAIRVDIGQPAAEIAERIIEDAVQRAMRGGGVGRGEEAYDARVRETFVDVAGRITSIPVQRKKRLAVLRWLVEDFQPGRLYSEAEVNQIVSRRHPDFAALRRYLVDEEFMQRRRGVYWRTGSVPNVGWDPPVSPEQ